MKDDKDDTGDRAASGEGAPDGTAPFTERPEDPDRTGDAVPASAEVESGVRLVVVVAVRRRAQWPPVRYDAGGLAVSSGEWVVFPMEHGMEVGQVVGNPVQLNLPRAASLPAVSRLASTQEIEQYYQNFEREMEARAVCAERIHSLGLAMKLVQVESYFDGSKIIFSYSAENRVDFRELVRDLVRALRTRVEMRQIGVRHEAKMLGGVGNCGRMLCCASFLKGFDPISIRMAKAQNLPLNPGKISGICGRLLCCLTYEYDTYLNLKRRLPAIGSECLTASGEGKVVGQDLLRQQVTVVLADGARIDVRVEDLGEAEANRQGEAEGRGEGEVVAAGEGAEHRGGEEEAADMPDVLDASAHEDQAAGDAGSGRKEEGGGERRPRRQRGRVKGRKRPKQAGGQSGAVESGPHPHAAAVGEKGATTEGPAKKAHPRNRQRMREPRNPSQKAT